MVESQFNSEERERYARHLVLPEIGGAGQQRLKRASVFVVGMGGLGAPAVQYLAAAGIGQLTIADDDVVSLSNLQRQTIHTTDSVGQLKTESALRAVSAINPHVVVNVVNTRINAENAPSLLKGVTIALDGSDNFETRYAMAQVCEREEVPLVTAAVGRFDGSLTTLRPFETGPDGELNPRYQDLFPQRPADDVVPTCAQAGILGAVTGIMGTLQAMETIKQITGAGDGLVRRLLLFDGLAMRFSEVSYRRQGS